MSVEAQVLKVHKSLPAIPKDGSAGRPVADLEAEREMFKFVISQCMQNGKLIMSVHSALQNRLKQDQLEEQEADLLPVMPKVNSIPPHIRMDMISQVGDIGTDSITECVAKDPQADLQMIEFCTGLPGHFKIERPFRVLSVMEQGFEFMSDQFGSRLKHNWHATAIIGAASGGPKVNWAHGVYTPTYDKLPPHRLLKLRHWQGVIVDVPTTHAFANVTKAWDLQDNWSDFGAYFELPPALPVHCRKFFGEPKDKQGPFSLPLVQIGQNAKVLHDFMEAKFQEWQTAQARAKATSAASTAVENRLATTKSKLNAVLKTKAKAKASTTKQKAKDTMLARKQSRKALKRENSTASNASRRG